VNRPAIPPEPDPQVAPDSWALAGEAGRLGIELAGRIAAEFGRLVPLAPPTDVRQDPARALRSAQVQLERTVGGVLEALAETIDAYADLVGQGVGAFHRRARPGLETVTVTTAPSRSGAVTLWIHNTTDAESGDLVLRPTAFVDGDGRTLAAAVDIGDASNVRVAAGTSHPVTLTVTATSAALPGRYHGMVLVGGVDDALVHVCVDVGMAE
jgi:hypothetical protein